MPDSSPSSGLDTWMLVDQANRGDRKAFDALTNHVSARLAAIAHRMLGRYPQVRRWEETDDVVQEALIRLNRSLREVKPDSVGGFFGLATTLIRRTLIDLTRHYYGVYGLGANYQSAARNDPSSGHAPPPFEAADTAEQLDDWTAFHQAVEQLAEAEREAFTLMWYGGLTQKQIANLLQISERTVVRRMNRARLALNEMLAERQPTLEGDRS